MKRADLVALGRVVRSQGRDGRIKLKLNEKGTTGFAGRTVYIDRDGALQAFDVEALDLDRNAYIMKLRGVETLAAADALAGREIYAAEADFRTPGGGGFYDFQVIGSRVVTRDGTEVGEVVAVLPAGGPMLLVVRQGSREVYVPFIDSICVAVDPAAREVVIDPPDGLLDLNEI